MQSFTATGTVAALLGAWLARKEMAVTQPLIRIWSPDPDDESEGCSDTPPASWAQKSRAWPDDALRQGVGDGRNGVMSLTVREVIDLYIANGTKGQAHEALKERHRLWGLFVDKFGERPITDCRAADLLLWINGNSEWKSDWTLLRVANTIKRPFAWATRCDLIPRNPFLAVTFPPGERGRPITPEEFHAILRDTDAVFRRVLIFQYETGARPHEMSALEWDFIDFNNAVAVLRVHKTMRTRKDRAPRVIALSTAAIKLLLWIKKNQAGSSRFVFLNSRGGKWTRSALDLRIWRLRKKIGLPDDVKLYGCRHALATNLAEAGVEAKAIAEVLGQTTTRMAEHYIHVSGNRDYLHTALAKRKKGHNKPSSRNSDTLR